ncbi:MAG: hypothetical protein WBP49_10570 [Acidimicrobiia bacterium]
MIKYKQLFKVWSIEDDETEKDAIVLSADDAYAAVRLWAEEYDCDGDYPIIGIGSQPVVGVLDVASGQRLTMIVSGEYVPTYDARLVSR